MTTPNCAQFKGAAGYLDTASIGLPPDETVARLEQAISRWQAGRSKPKEFDRDIQHARELFSSLVGAPARDVAVGPQVSPFVGLIAASLPQGSRVLCAEGDFTSLLFPLLVQQQQERLTVELVPLQDLAAAVTAETTMVAFSAVQSRNGAVADLDALLAAKAKSGTQLLVDATQAAGWLPLDATKFDYLVAGGYKWLLNPRGTAYCYVAPGKQKGLTPIHAGWYAGAEIWDAIYGAPLRLAQDARQFDISPAWFSWVGAVPALETICAQGIESIYRHNVQLANRLREKIGLPSSNSAIVSFAATDAAERLAQADIRASYRDANLRVGFHLYNGEEDVDRVVQALGPSHLP